jgi:hypothetical protein
MHRSRLSTFVLDCKTTDLDAAAEFWSVVFDVIFSITVESILTVTARERGTARSVTATFSAQYTPEAVRRRLANPAYADESEENGKGGGLFGWFKGATRSEPEMRRAARRRPLVLLHG